MNTEGITLYAQWTLNTYTVRFFDFDETTQIGTNQTLNHGDDATAPTDPTRTGYSFAGWNPASLTNITADTDFTAQYLQDPTVGTITPNPANDGTEVTLELTNVEEGVTVTIDNFSCTPNPADNSGEVTCTATVDEAGGYDGSSQTITLTDSAGNTNTNTQTPAITVDNTPPATSST